MKDEGEKDISAKRKREKKKEVKKWKKKIKREKLGTHSKIQSTKSQNLT